MKRCLILWTLLFCCGTAAAAPSPSESDAVSFGYQAGAIAGAAQACGQDVSLLSNRTAEAIGLLVQNDSDRSRALGAYQQSMHDAASAQTASQKIACSQVLMDYNALPILKDDYRQTVLSQMVPSTPAGPTNNVPRSATATPAPVNPTTSAPGVSTQPVTTSAGAEAQQVAAALTVQPGQPLPPGVGQALNNNNPVLRDNSVVRPTYGAPTNPVLQNNPLIESNNIAPSNPVLRNNPAYQNNFVPPQVNTPAVASAGTLPSY